MSEGADNPPASECNNFSATFTSSLAFGSFGEAKEQINKLFNRHRLRDIPRFINIVT